MSLFFREHAPERRAVDSWTIGLDPSNRRTKSGVSVNGTSAMKLGAVWSATTLLASTVSNLPVDVFRGAGPSKTPVTPQPPLVSSPSLLVSRREWVYQAMMSLLLRGNAYGYIVERDGALRPKTVEWLNPDNVVVEQKSALSRPTYKVGGKPVSSADLIHMRAFVQPGSAVGLSPVEYHAETIGLGISAQAFGAQWFGDGGHPSAIFRRKDGSVTPEQAANIKERFLALLKGKREPLVIGAEYEYLPIQVSANESQFLESQGYTDAQVARIYGPGIAEVLGYETGGNLTYSNRVDRSLDLQTYSVQQWVNKFEDMLTDAIAQPQMVKFNLNAMLRADPKTRHEMYRIDREIGLYNIDEIRELEDQPPLPDDAGKDFTPLKLATPPAAPNPGGTDGNQ